MDKKSYINKVRYEQYTNAASSLSPIVYGSLIGNALTATNVAYSGLTGTVPTWNQNTTGTANLAIALTTTLPINKGGTGQTTQKGAIDALLPDQSGNADKLLKTNGISASWTVLAAPASTLTGATLASTVLASSLKSVGTLDALTVSATITGSITGNAGTATTANTVTNPNLTGEVTTSGLTATVANSAVIAKVLNGYTKSSGAIVSTDTILQAIQKLEGNVSTIDGGFPSDNYSNITTIDGGTP